MIDLKRLFTKMNENGFYYFSGLTNTNGIIDIMFSTGNNGRGDTVEMECMPNDTYRLDIDINNGSFENTISKFSEKEVNDILDKIVFKK